jgi:hypothetical protein
MATTFISPPSTVTHGRLRRAAIKWMVENPKALSFFEKFALELLQQKKRFGIDLIRERVRWETYFTYNGEYKFANAHAPYIARYLIHKHPELADYMTCHPTTDEDGVIQLITEAELQA